MNNKLGIGWPNYDVDDTELEWVTSVGADNYVLLHDQAYILPDLRAACPNARIVMRFFDKGILSQNPSTYAQRVCTEAIRWRDYTREWQYACEPNLELESGPGYDDPDRVAEWCVDVATELRRLAPWMIIHSPPMSPVGNWWLYYTALMENEDVFYIIDCHAYESAQAMKSIVLSVCSQTDKVVFISECNGPGTMELFRWIQDEPQILGAAYFIWEWRNADSGWDRDLKGSALEEELRALAQEEDLGRKKKLTYAFELGFKDYAADNPVVGLPTEALQYDNQGNAWQHTDTGLLLWHKARNQTHFFEVSNPF